MTRPIPSDDDGQPPPAIHARLRAERSVSELLGFARGIVCDGKVDPEEARALRRWLSANPDVATSFPGRQIAERITAIFQDGRVDEDECEALRELLDATIGQEEGEEVSVRNATRLGLDDPPPKLVFDGQTYVFTGNFYFGSRKDCERAVIERGGRCESSVTNRTNVVVIGTVASRDWAEATHGTKYLRALELREQGRPVAIVAEAHWVAALDA